MKMLDSIAAAAFEARKNPRNPMGCCVKPYFKVMSDSTAAP
jgi:hypothetical protein